MIKSIYIHIPFCNKICSYCDFSKMLYNEQIVNNYLNELQKEIKDNYKNEPIKTLYIGGGSPSSLTINQLNFLFKITNSLNLSKLKEFTIEFNIEDITKEKLEICKLNKVNRISIGIESFNKDLLKIMNRNTNPDEIKEKINLVKKYFNNINVDLIYGFKEETSEILENDLDNLINLDINHISTYSLIIEEHTNLYINKYKRLDDDTDYLFYKRIINKLKNNNFNHYEISNFSKKRYESLHNLCYWNNEEYYGFGLGAGGYINNIRYQNTRSLNKYLNHEYRLYQEKLEIKDKKEYEMILGLRKVKGVNKKKFINKYNCTITDSFDIIDLISKGLLKENKNYIYIPKNKLYIENGILINFLGGSKNE